MSWTVFLALFAVFSSDERTLKMLDSIEIFKEGVAKYFCFNLFCFCDALSRKALSLSEVNNITTKAESQALFYNFFHSFNLYTI